MSFEAAPRSLPIGAVASRPEGDVSISDISKWCLSLPGINALSESYDLYGQCWQ
jgi:hypothetical protein